MGGQQLGGRGASLFPMDVRHTSFFFISERWRLVRTRTLSLSLALLDVYQSPSLAELVVAIRQGCAVQIRRCSGTPGCHSRSSRQDRSAKLCGAASSGHAARTCSVPSSKEVVSVYSAGLTQLVPFSAKIRIVTGCRAAPTSTSPFSLLPRLRGRLPSFPRTYLFSCC